MIRGAFIFGAGFGVGCAFTLSHNEDIREAVIAFKQFLHDEALKSDIERREAADKEAKAADAGNKPHEAEDDVEEDDKPIDAEVVDPGATPSQGETPS